MYCPSSVKSWHHWTAFGSCFNFIFQAADLVLRAPLHISNANVSYVSAAKKTTPTTICEVSNFLGTVHHEYVFTIEEALDALPDVKGPKRAEIDRTMDDLR